MAPLFPEERSSEEEEGFSRRIRERVGGREAFWKKFSSPVHFWLCSFKRAINRYGQATDSRRVVSRDELDTSSVFLTNLLPCLFPPDFSSTFFLPLIKRIFDFSKERGNLMSLFFFLNNFIEIFDRIFERERERRMEVVGIFSSFRWLCPIDAIMNRTI